MNCKIPSPTNMELTPSVEGPGPVILEGMQKVDWCASYAKVLDILPGTAQDMKELKA